MLFVRNFSWDIFVLQWVLYLYSVTHPDLLSNQIMKVKVLLTKQEKKEG